MESNGENASIVKSKMCIQLLSERIKNEQQPWDICYLMLGRFCIECCSNVESCAFFFFFFLFVRVNNLFYICAWISSSSFLFCTVPLNISIFLRGSKLVFLDFLYHLPLRDTICLQMSWKNLVQKEAMPWRNIAKEMQSQVFHSMVLYLRN